MNPLKGESKTAAFFDVQTEEEIIIKGFFETAETTFLYKIISPQTFFPLIKDYPPRIVLLNNGNVAGDWDYESFSVADLKKIITE